MEKHTLDHFKEVRYSDLFDRKVLNKWEKEGTKKMEQRLQELTLKFMEHRPAPLSDEIIAELDKMQASWK